MMIVVPYLVKAHSHIVVLLYMSVDKNQWLSIDIFEKK